MMHKLIRWLLRTLGLSAFWLAWPLYIVYFRLSERTRVIVVRGDEILVVVNWVSDGKWSLPGGGMHPSETPIQGAVRELKEEVGIDTETEHLKLIGKGLYKSYGHRYTFHCFVLELDGDVVIKKQLHEIADAAWVDWRILDRQNAAPDVLYAVQLWQQSQKY